MPMWKTKEGQYIDVQNMDNRHVTNCYKSCLSVLHPALDDGNYKRAFLYLTWVMIFRNELLARQLPIPVTINPIELLEVFNESQESAMPHYELDRESEFDFWDRED